MVDIVIGVQVTDDKATAHVHAMDGGPVELSAVEIVVAAHALVDALVEKRKAAPGHDNIDVGLGLTADILLKVIGLMTGGDVTGMVSHDYTAPASRAN